MTTSLAVFTGNRAEYFLLRQLMREIDADARFSLLILVCGSHLEEKFGHTVDHIEEDGFNVNFRIPLNLKDDGALASAHAMSITLKGVADALDAARPDALVLLGDRYELLAAAAAAVAMSVPIVHLHGGELTFGAKDDLFRHSVSKLSHLHFAAAEVYRNRLIQMGEAPERVYNVGALGVDAAMSYANVSTETVRRFLGFDPADPFFLVTFHPVTESPSESQAGVRAMLDAFEVISHVRVVFTGVNADPGNDVVRSTIKAWAAEHSERTRTFETMGQEMYFAAISHCRAVVGNSSSGIIEAPAFRTITVDIGTRQQGRLTAPSVLSVQADAAAVTAALQCSLSDTDRKQLTVGELPYGGGGTAERIIEILGETDFRALAPKPFYDGEMDRDA